MNNQQSQKLSTMSIYSVVLNKLINLLWPRSQLVIKPGQSVVIIGRPGTGKSTLLRWLLKDAGSVIVYDSKFDPDEWPRQPDYVLTEKAGELGAYPRVVLRCKQEWFRNPEDWSAENHPWGLALDHPMQRGNTIAVFDEAIDTWPVRGGHPGTHQLIQKGRSFGVIVIVGSQLANNIDTRLLRMANHIFVMGPCKHKTEQDALFAANHANIEPLKKLKLHQIAWWSDTRDRWTVFRPIKMSRLHSLRERKVEERIQISKWIWALLAIIAIILEVLSLNRFGIFLTILFHSVIVGYISSRAWFVREWRVWVRSGEWTPISIEEAFSDNTIRKRPPKSFRVV